MKNFKAIGLLRARAWVCATFLFAVCALCATPAVAAAPQLSASAAQQMQVLIAIKAAKTPTQNKIDSRLYLGLLHKRQTRQLAALPDFRFVNADNDGRIAVDVALADAAAMKPVLNRLEALGAVVKAKSVAYRHISARVHFEDLEPLAAMSAVRKVRQFIPGMTSKINTSEGDKTHGVDEARSYFGATGAGVKVCAMSDGVDSLAALQGSDDLPAVDVLAGQAGSGDEGSAMLEIVHDLAPQAALGFASASTDEATFAQNILDLASAGCNIIVDDYIYLDESPFEDGPVAQAVNTVTASGVLYFSSAGNEGNKDDGTSGTWEGDFLASASADPAPLAGANLHDFGDGGNSVLVANGSSTTPAVLTWAEHYDLASGSASTDYDIYDMDGGLTTIFDASTDTQDGTGGDDFPIEYIGGGVFTGERLLIDKFAAGATSSTPMFNLIVFRGQLDNARSTNGATRGHSGAAAAFSVAATPAAASFDGVTPAGPYPGLFNGANASESFSSDGPRRLILNSDGSEITPGNRTSTGGAVRQKPDITAADGVSTAAPGFNPFYGTSAAAPHAAAIAAVLKSAVPGLTPAQVRTALVNSALDIEGAGTDRDTGAGIVMAHAALQAAGAVPGAVMSAGTAVPSQVAGDGDGNIENNEIWNLSVPLTNVGGAAATAISATLTTTTLGVTIPAATSSYPDLAAGASASDTVPFTFVVDAIPCGSSIDFTLSVNFTGGEAQSFDISLATGGAGTPLTFSYAGAAVPIPDGLDLSGNAPGAPALASLPVTSVGPIYDVDLRIDGSTCSATAGSATVGIDHSFINDLQVSLLSPDGTSVMVIQNTDGGGNNLCQTELNDQSVGPSIQSVATANAPFTGSYTPKAPLAAFNGKSADGNWQLEAQDFFSQDTGNIRAFSVVITPAVCDAPPRVPAAITISAGDGQSTLIGSAFATPIVAHIVDGTGYPIAGAEIDFSAPLSGASAILSAASATTDSNGDASVTATANDFAGSYVVNAHVAGVTPDAVATLNNLAGDPAVQVALIGTPQSTPVGTGFAVPLGVQVRDAWSNPVPGVTVAFSAPASGASATLSAPSAITDANGVAAITAVANDQAGVYAVDASVEGLPQGSQFTLTNTSPNVELGVSVDGGGDYVQYGRMVDYVVTLSNSGLSDAHHVALSSVLAPQLDPAFASWMCLDAGSGACAASGTGALNDSEVTIPAHGSVSYLLSAPVRFDAAGDSAGTSVTATSPDQVDPATATYTMTLVIFRNDFDRPYADGANSVPIDPQRSFEAGDWLRFAPPPASMQAVQSVLHAFAADGSGFRVERLVHGNAVWLRLVAVDRTQRERAGLWQAADPLAGLDLQLLDADGDARVLVIAGAQTLRLDLEGAPQHYLVSSPARLIEAVPAASD